MLASPVWSLGHTTLHKLAALLPDDRSLLLLAHHTALAGLPRAQAVLRHFLSGNPQTWSFSTASLLRDNPSIVRRIRAQIIPDRCQDLRVTIHQRDYDRRDWAWALGSLALHVRFPTAHAVIISAHGRYRWSPAQPRFRQALHQAAAALVAKEHAAEVTLTGSPVEMPILRLTDFARPQAPISPLSRWWQPLGPL